MLGRIIAFVYGLAAYTAFFVTILYAIGFLCNLVVPKSIDAGTVGPVGWAVLINVSLLAVFAIQHTIMARPAFKQWWTKIISPAVERSTFVLLSSLILGLIFWQWRPMTSVAWDVQYEPLRMLLHGLFFLGFGLVFLSSFLIDHFDLFGMRQVFLHLTGKPYTPPQFRMAALYKLVRHPLMLGFLIAVWAAPTMTTGHLLFAAVITAYIFIGIQFEERDLRRALGEDYEEYRRTTPMILPIPKRRRRRAPQPVA